LQSVLLPLSTPLSKAYPHHAYQLSILASKEETHSWIFMNYFHLVAEPGNDNPPVTFYLPNETGLHRSCLSPWFEHRVLSRSFIIENRLDFSIIIKNAILNHNYIYLYINERYIPGTYWHSIGKDYNHSLLLHGYSVSTDEVFFLIYDATRTLTVQSIPMEELAQAFYDNQYRYDRYESKVYLLKLRGELGFTLRFDPNYMSTQLLTYRDEKPVRSSVLHGYADERCRYGLGVYDSMVELLDRTRMETREAIREGFTIPMHLLMEHKHIMVERLKFLADRYNSLELSPFIEAFESLKKAFEALRNNALKFEMTGSEAILSKAITRMFELKGHERNTLTQLIDYLQNNHTESE
jgi:hypothetical protein